MPRECRSPPAGPARAAPRRPPRGGGMPPPRAASSSLPSGSPPRAAAPSPRAESQAATNAAMSALSAQPAPVMAVHMLLPPSIWISSARSRPAPFSGPTMKSTAPVMHTMVLQALARERAARSPSSGSHVESGPRPRGRSACESARGAPLFLFPRPLLPPASGPP